MSKIIFNREQLLQRLKKCIQFIPKKAILPCHESFLFEVRSDRVYITAMDNEKQITAWCHAVEREEDVTFCIPARLLLSTLNLLLEEEITFIKKNIKSNNPLDIGKCTVEIKSGKSKYKLQCDDGSVYPKSQHIVSEFEASFIGSAFISSMEIASKFANADADQPFKQGICMRMIDSAITMYGASSIATAKVVSAPRSINNWDDIVIPVKTANAIVKSFNDIDIIDITHNKDKVEFKTDEVTIIALAFNLKYPDIEIFFSKKHNNKVILNTVQFSKSVERLSLYAKEEMPAININIKTTGIEMSVDNSFYNRNGDETIDVIAEKEVSISLNPIVLMHTLSSFASDEFILFYGDYGNLIYIEPLNTLSENNKFFVIATLKES